MDLTLVLQFWTVAILLALTPGADWAYAIAAGLQPRSVVPSILGMVSGYVVVVAVVALGIGALVTEYPAALTALTLAGAAYLLYLGVSTLFVRLDAPVTASARPVGSSAWTRFVRGAGVSGINPKGVLLLLALLPQFVAPGGWPAPLQMGVLGSLHLLDCAVVYLLVALAARRILGSRPRAGLVVTKVSGALMVLIGLGLLAEQLVHLLH
ncbi:LysE family translocator [Curtobacterium sp. A7_M15]|uniref:LysE family translocator n=1 Tax=Curtobacterium sp. A7_M15 TaxID=3065241 RepID=UPI002737DCAE|nr:LysE family translocator [Curtobacterium sp. A7_M15]MDP4333643.1 LysE family translocator [Curtobacterium sp. A7_M15]